MLTVEQIIDEEMEKQKGTTGTREGHKDAVSRLVLSDLKKRGELPLDGEASSTDQDQMISEEKVEEVRALVRNIMCETSVEVRR